MTKLTFRQKIWLFANTFKGLGNVYGTYDPVSGKSWQVKQQVTGQVAYDHLCGKRPFGVYLLTEDKIKAAAVDFDHELLVIPVEFVGRLMELGLQSHIEISKSKGYHVWLFFAEYVKAASVRRIIRKVLTDMGKTSVEVFPKQDRLQGNIRFGNFINAPLFGKLVLAGKTVFLDLDNMPNPHDDQWQFLEMAQRYTQADLNDILSKFDVQPPEPVPVRCGDTKSDPIDSFGLVPCVRRMLQEGVDSYQRVACFRLAVRLQRMGLPFDIALAALQAWSVKNNPINGKRVITPQEILHQTTHAYKKSYRGFGCEDPAIKCFCSKDCPILLSRAKEN